MIIFGEVTTDGVLPAASSIALPVTKLIVYLSFDDVTLAFAYWI
jgi:hypothetical protein